MTWGGTDVILVEISEWVKSLSYVRLFVTPGTVAYQAPLSMGFSRQECWSGAPLPSPIEIKCTINNALESARNHPPTPGPWKNCLSQNQFLMPKRLGTAAVVSALLNLLLGSKRNKLRGICEDESWAEAQSHSSPSSFQSLGELWNTKSHAKPHMDEELTSCPAQSVSHEVQTTLCGDSVIFEVSGQWQILGDR